jgi:hypothetical protein
VLNVAFRKACLRNIRATAAPKATVITAQGNGNIATATKIAAPIGVTMN